MTEIKTAEISAILREQLAHFGVNASLGEVGTVLQVSDDIAYTFGLSNVQYGGLVKFDNGLKDVVLSLEEDSTGVTLLDPSTNIKRGNIIRRAGLVASIDVSEDIVGRVASILGQPIDGRRPLTEQLHEMPLKCKTPGAIFRQPMNEPL